MPFNVNIDEWIVCEERKKKNRGIADVIFNPGHSKKDNNSNIFVSKSIKYTPLTDRYEYARMDKKLTELSVHRFMQNTAVFLPFLF